MQNKYDHCCKKPEYCMECAVDESKQRPNSSALVRKAQRIAGQLQLPITDKE